ncbi:hypothetical protein NDU88_001358 [Pleurodeles waltl]|uniref:Uncharacterized protein n=1 Tax=Pleurodeles waltl TaxID=8319 RepID=A0AAV7PCB8_PLEWA|nr:hypothetical protein NDU88_001358 [Pleurodeles waltl]
MQEAGIDTKDFGAYSTIGDMASKAFTLGARLKGNYSGKQEKWMILAARCLKKEEGSWKAQPLGTENLMISAFV